ncbi:MAG: glucose 1-dehydrogenase [Microcoleus vaginatus WJT46-NPBG5]|jgi:NAD(P)-dependent dehydrogenase (short-subunit alcohol dehydrogenase family)|nr:glucose 1-dehydrogenase [Microcoleus vaginatus WJT46-NPBG5]
MARRVEGKVALVTGGASGIGKATVEMLVREGAQVVITDMNESEGKTLIEEIPGTIFLWHNVTNETLWESVISETITEFGKLDILVNCAGVTGMKAPQNPENTTLDTWRQVMSVNMEGVFLGCKHAIPAMKEKGGGSIVNVSSYAGIIGTPFATAYGASKAGVQQFSKSIALYCAQQGYKIRCNSILPGAILTPLWEPFLSGEEREERMKQVVKDIPLKVWGEPDDVAYAILYLASDESKFVTGSEIVVDGGQSAV